ncbi:hypothetical protein ACFQRL_11295 [Microbacterium fluvii]|uniref:Uncharacterized protein n=1 Tax=Microbacterium fluvii TaxID=415215 RepID=A0ABW2HEZ5_9MICO|nr:hypothetical protein [Microbacterium fluvii]MCU4673180.1 hypothetical protein [Microbacterium fluvii]
MPWDSPLAALCDIVTAVGDLADVGEAGGMSIESVVVETPLELSVRARAAGDVDLAAAPPRQARETSVMPVLHRIRLRVEPTP